MELPNELNERMMMGIEGYFNENINLLDEEIIRSINEHDGVSLVIIFIYYSNSKYFEDYNFGKFIVSNGYLDESDEDEIIKYVKLYDDLYYISYCRLNTIKKINYFASIYCYQHAEIIINLINDIYNARDSRVDLK